MERAILLGRLHSGGGLPVGGHAVPPETAKHLAIRGVFSKGAPGRQLSQLNNVPGKEGFMAESREHNVNTHPHDRKDTGSRRDGDDDHRGLGFGCADADTGNGRTFLA